MRPPVLPSILSAAAAAVLLTVALVAGGLAAAASVDDAGRSAGPPDENARIAAWRAQRLASLTSETGWLTPVALYWLKEGDNSFGRAEARAFPLDDAALAPDTGVFILQNHHVRYVAHAANTMTYLGKPVTSLDLVSDAAEKPSELIAGTLHFVVIDRAGHLGVRVRDSVSPNRVQFKGLQNFPVRTDWLVHARFEPYVPAHSIRIVNILGMTEDMTSPGAIVFERSGRTWRLDAILEDPGDDQLFVMFADATSGKQTYGAGRFLYIGLPEGGLPPSGSRDSKPIDIDFNEAFNPPCAFTDFATCPLPPEQNRLALAIEAGELKYERAH